MSAGEDQTPGQTTLFPLSPASHGLDSGDPVALPSPEPAAAPSGGRRPARMSSSSSANDNNHEKQDQPPPPPRRSTRLSSILATAAAPPDGGPAPDGAGPHRHKVRYRFLTPTEWAVLAHAVGGVRDEEGGHMPVHPACWWWPPRGMPQGLYRDVIANRFKYFLAFHALSLVRWTALLMQLCFGATLTALGPQAHNYDMVITVLAAANTINAGILAALQNSGLPERYRSDRDEFREVEDRIRELLDGGFVEDGLEIDQVLAECFARYQDAKSTVKANIPASYTPSSILQAGRRAGARAMVAAAAGPGQEGRPQALTTEGSEADPFASAAGNRPRGRL